MDKATLKTIISIIVVVLVIAGIGVFTLKMNKGNIVLNNDEAEVRTIVESFGEQLKMVSLTADTAIAQSSIEQAYAPYVSSELLNKWKASPLAAPGRFASSPYPDRIEIEKIDSQLENTYKVTGTIIEVANTGGSGSPTVAAKRPITLVVTKNNNAWQITEAELGNYQQEIYTAISNELEFNYYSLSTTYIAAREWPPTLLKRPDATTCKEETRNENGLPVKVEKRPVDSNIYCRMLRQEGAAGSVYNSYSYALEKDGNTYVTEFVLRYVNCGNFDENEKKACETEQKQFDPDSIADTAIMSARAAN